MLTLLGGRKKEIIAEARFLRAFAQLYLMKHYAFFWDLDSKYGPLMRRVPGTLSNNNMERSGVREAYNLILEDLDYAIDYGPVYKDVFFLLPEDWQRGSKWKFYY